jgi:hypothetical protein
VVVNVRTGWRPYLLPALSIVLLNASLTFGNVWPTAKIAWGNALSVELAFCILMLAVAHRWAPALARRVLPFVWVLLVAGHYLDVTAPGLYGREFNVYWDSRHLGDVVGMLARAVSWWLIVVAAAAVLLTTVLTYVLARLAIGEVALVMVHRRARVAFGSLAGVVIALFIGQRAVERLPFDIEFADPVTSAYVRQARFAMAMFGTGPAAPSLGPSPALDTGLRSLGGIDVLLVFVESYGAITYQTPSISAALTESRADLERAIHQTRRQVVSAYVESPTFGASSWLAHLSLLSGVEVRDQYTYAALMASQRKTLVTNFAQRGYRTVALMPGMRQAWPEGAFYGFDVIYGHDHLEYEGPQFGWWGIPDQYALARLDALERRHGSRAPVFVVFPTSTSHAPFGPVPPYQPAWPRVLTEDAFEPADVKQAMAAMPDLSNLTPSYARAIAYELTSLAGYLRTQADDLLMIVIGDHQPPAAVSGRAASRHVPVHVIASRQPVLDHLRKAGFHLGLEPLGPSIGAMHQLVPMLLDAFDVVPDEN